MITIAHTKTLAYRLHQQELDALRRQPPMEADIYIKLRCAIEARLTENLRRIVQLQQRAACASNLALEPMNQPRQVGESALLLDARGVL